MRPPADQLRSVRAWCAALRHPSPQRDVLTQVLKTGLAAGLAWEAAARVLHGPRPFYAPLAALLTVHTTVLRSVISAGQRVAGSIIGLLLAYVLAQLLPLSGWTVGLVVCLAMAVSRWQRLGEQSAQVPIAALLLLLLGRNDPSRYALARVLETLLGAAVGAAVNLLVAPPAYLRSAADAVGGVAESISGLLGDVAAGLAGDWPAEPMERWLDDARRMPRQLAAARDTLERGRESRRLNPRPTARHAALDVLARQLDVLEHLSVPVRSIVRLLSDAAADDSAGPLDPAFRRRAGALLGALAAPVRELQHADPDSVHHLVAGCRTEVRRLAQQPVRDLRARITRDSLLADVDRLLAEVDDASGPPPDANRG